MTHSTYGLSLQSQAGERRGDKKEREGLTTGANVANTAANASAKAAATLLEESIKAAGCA